MWRHLSLLQRQLHLGNTGRGKKVAHKYCDLENGLIFFGESFLSLVPWTSIYTIQSSDNGNICACKTHIQAKDEHLKKIYRY